MSGTEQVTRQRCLVTTEFTEAYRQTWSGSETVIIEHVTLECPLSLEADRRLVRGCEKTWDH